LTGPRTRTVVNAVSGFDLGMRQQESGVRILLRDRRDVGVELVDATGDPREQLEAVIPPGAVCGGKASARNSARARWLRNFERRAKRWLRAIACRPFLTLIRMRTSRTRCATSVRRSRVRGSVIHTVADRRATAPRCPSKHARAGNGNPARCRDHQRPRQAVPVDEDRRRDPRERRTILPTSLQVRTGDKAAIDTRVSVGTVP